jgi:hypothetical protein
MAKPFDTNLVTKLWITISNNVLLTQRLSKYLKLVEIVVVSMLGFVEDEQTFSTLAFMKDKLRNRLGLHLDTTLYMFAQKFYTQESFHYKEAITTWKDQKVQIGVVLSKFYSFHSTKLECSYFHDPDKSSDYAWFFMKFINTWVWWVKL